MAKKQISDLSEASIDALNGDCQFIMDDQNKKTKKVSFSSLKTKITSGIDDTNIVHINGNEAITGDKTFTGMTTVSQLPSTNDNSTMVASTKWVTEKLNAWWNSVRPSIMSVLGEIGVASGSGQYADNWTYCGRFAPNSEVRLTLKGEIAEDYYGNTIVWINTTQSKDGATTYELTGYNNSNTLFNVGESGNLYICIRRGNLSHTNRVGSYVYYVGIPA